MAIFAFDLLFTTNTPATIPVVSTSLSAKADCSAIASTNYPVVDRLRLTWRNVTRLAWPCLFRYTFSINFADLYSAEAGVQIRFFYDILSLTTRGRRCSGVIRFILYHIHSVITGRQRKGLGGVCALSVLLLHILLFYLGLKFFSLFFQVLCEHAVDKVSFSAR